MAVDIIALTQTAESNISRGVTFILAGDLEQRHSQVPEGGKRKLIFLLPVLVLSGKGEIDTICLCFLLRLEKV